MAHLRWNFSRLSWWAKPSLFVCVIAVMGCLHALWWRNDLLQQREILVKQARQTYAVMGNQERRVFASPSPALDQVFREMRFPWDDVLGSLQRATKPGVQLLHLAPDDGDARRLNIEGVADQAKNVFDLVVALQEDPSWSSVQLLSQTKTDGTPTTQNNGSPLPPLPPAPSRSIAFSLVAKWNR